MQRRERKIITFQLERWDVESKNAFQRAVSKVIADAIYSGDDAEVRLEYKGAYVIVDPGAFVEQAVKQFQKQLNVTYNSD